MADATAFPDGAEAASASGTIAAIGAALIALAGASMTFGVGAVSTGVAAGLTGVEALSAAGDVSPYGSPRAYPSGVSATAEAGSVAASGNASTTVAGVGISISLGYIVTTGTVIASPTGVGMTAGAGDMTISVSTVLRGLRALSVAGAPAAAGARSSVIATDSALVAVTSSSELLSHVACAEALIPCVSASDAYHPKYQ